MIDAEKIMKEIRNEICEKGLNKEILSFEDCPSPSVRYDYNSSDHMFDIEFFLDNVNRMNHTCMINPNRILTGNPIIVLIKKVIRWLTRFYIEPLVSEQMEFNACTVRAANMVRNYILEDEKKKEDMREIIKRIKILEKK